MPVLVDRFRVKASPEAVSIFHHGTSALKRLTPPPVFVRLEHVEPLAEGSKSAFTMWFGPLPVRWLAVHSAVDPACGFTDTQARGPFKRWVHQHSWQRLDDGTTLMEERIEFDHHPGLRGLLTKVLFARPLIRMMFFYRRWMIRRAVETGQPA